MPLSARLTLIYQNHIPAIDTYGLWSSQLLASSFLKTTDETLRVCYKTFSSGLISPMALLHSLCNPSASSMDWKHHEWTVAHHESYQC